MKLTAGGGIDGVIILAKPTHNMWGYGMSILNAPYFQDEEAAYAKLEGIIWPHGPVCPPCGTMERMKRMGGKATRSGLHKCYACRKQSRVTVRTVFESSHIKLHV
jgi:hypothetical protein